MRNYDAWLEEPYQRMYAEGEAFARDWEDFCEHNDYDPADDTHIPEFEEWMKDREADAKIAQYEDWLEFGSRDY